MSHHFIPIKLAKLAVVECMLCLYYVVCLFNLLAIAGRIIFDEDLMTKSKESTETLVTMGSTLGKVGPNAGRPFEQLPVQEKLSTAATDQATPALPASSATPAIKPSTPAPEESVRGCKGCSCS